MGAASNFGWGWKEIGAHLERLWATEAHIAERLIRGLMRKTESLYAGNVGDDATLVGAGGQSGADQDGGTHDPPETAAGTRRTRCQSWRRSSTRQETRSSGRTPRRQ